MELEHGESQLSSSSSQPMSSVEIKPIEKSIVHRICSGQVIVTLSTAVKELVENSLDAGATALEIRLVEYGSHLIEVVDNGTGVEESNFEGLALKHHTSKITEFEDLTSIATFGFRGEALSSLCALADISVCTRSRETKLGFRIDYDSHGKIKRKMQCAREVGTTVTMKDLFVSLPVRHKELIKNLKREYHKMINVLYGYCLITSGVRINCTNQVGNSCATRVISVPAHSSIKERIVSLFGSKQASTLVPIQGVESVDESILAEYGLTSDMFEQIYSLEGFISVPNSGRSSNDRQYYFINSRPCESAKISRVVNEVYHSFSRSQYPFICLCIKTRQQNIDVNVTPDKRLIYVRSEQILLATIKATLFFILSSSSGSTGGTSLQSTLSPTFGLRKHEKMDVDDLSDHGSDVDTIGDGSDEKNEISRQIISPVQRSPNCRFAPQYSSSNASKSGKSMNFLQNFANKERSVASTRGYQTSAYAREAFTNLKRSKGAMEALEAFKFKKQPKIGEYFMGSSQNNSESESTTEDSLSSGLQSQVYSGYYNESDNGDEIVIEKHENTVLGKSEFSQQTLSDTSDVYDESDEDDKTSRNDRPIVRIPFSLSQIQRKSKQNHFEEREVAVKFRAKINPGDNTTAEDELKRQLKKTSFTEMKILGQFNLGFIVTKLDSDLFIVDQHASDEKYNFETLEKTTVLQSQRLISPLDLQLPAVSENIIIDHNEVFKKNGFEFEINANGRPTERVKLTKIPLSKSWEFGKYDVEELVFMLEDAPEKSFFRPTKVRQMFASRACRKSVMIGCSLGPKEMQTIVNHMSDMEQPWNCPHGRPTIRHLFNLSLLPDDEIPSFNH